MYRYLLLGLSVFLSGCFMDEDGIVNNGNINMNTHTTKSITIDKALTPSLSEVSGTNTDYVMWFEK